MGKKGPMPNYETIDEYIANQPEKAQTLLKELRSIITEVAPDVIEKLNYKVPSFMFVEGAKIDQQIMIAAYAKFVSFYPFPTTIEAFSKELKDYKQGKGSVQFPIDEPLPKDLIKRMVKHRKDKVLASR